MAFDERFTGLGPAVWTDAYLPAWSSRAAARAAHTVGDGLRLTVPPHHPLWCPDTHPGPLRVSGVQSANRSGPVGSTDAPQPFRDGLRVTEAQPTVLGFVPRYGRIGVTATARLTSRSMFSAWMVGLEDRPERCGEICLVEIFGRAVGTGPMQEATVEYGHGVHRFRDPALTEDFAAPRRVLDLAAPHEYAVDWRPDGVTFLLDGRAVRHTEQAPDYPMFLFLAVFDFPLTTGDPEDLVDPDGPPELHVRRVSHTG